MLSLSLSLCPDESNCLFSDISLKINMYIYIYKVRKNWYRSEKSHLTCSPSKWLDSWYMISWGPRDSLKGGPHHHQQRGHDHHYGRQEEGKEEEEDGRDLAALGTGRFSWNSGLANQVTHIVFNVKHHRRIDGGGRRSFAPLCLVRFNQKAPNSPAPLTTISVRPWKASL